MWTFCEKTGVIHKPLSTSRPCPAKFPLQWSACNKVIMSASLPKAVFIYARLDTHSCGQPAFTALPTCFASPLPCYLPSSPTGLLSTPGNTVYPPTSGHLHCSLFVRHSPLPTHLSNWLFIPRGGDIHSFMFLPQHLKQMRYYIYWFTMWLISVNSKQL